MDFIIKMSSEAQKRAFFVKLILISSYLSFFVKNFEESTNFK